MSLLSVDSRQVQRGPGSSAGPRARGPWNPQFAVQVAADAGDPWAGQESEPARPVLPRPPVCCPCSYVPLTWPFLLCASHSRKAGDKAEGLLTMLGNYCVDLE
jgi:hypothetical protein